METLGGITRSGAGVSWKYKRSRVVLGLGLLAPLLAASPNAEAQVYAGACVFNDIAVTYLAGPENGIFEGISFAGSGVCTTADGDKTGTINATVNAPSALFTCAGGAGVSSDGEFTVPGVHVTGAVVAVTVTGGVAEVVLVDDNDRLVGTGAFVPDPADLVNCPTSEAFHTTWCGGFVFAATDTVVPTTED